MPKIIKIYEILLTGIAENTISSMLSYAVKFCFSVKQNFTALKVLLCYEYNINKFVYRAAQKDWCPCPLDALQFCLSRFYYI